MVLQLKPRGLRFWDRPLFHYMKRTLYMGLPHYGNGPAVEYTFCLVWGVLCNHLRRKVIPYRATGRC
ncbi:unnamed protein product [Cuscuta campestris]|uniref:Uncharacterized protein n=1 Tax=Cuscuta campestris TaxID=132261 RepID=A0A484MLS5_9ASTE|nr:unnamed protein product [Cuscuta campestris]